MLNKEKHQLVMGQILRDIYADTSVSSLIGFKGGTCAYFLYGLNRFSVDLDFDLLSADRSAPEIIYKNIGDKVKAYGEVKDQHIKRNTIFFLISYGDAGRNIKVEINTRPPMSNIKEYYKFREYLGIAMLAAKKDYIFASKLAALTDRRLLAMRDIYDVWFFAKNHWDINAEVIKIRTGKTIKKYIADCLSVIEAVKDNEILRGLAELLLDEKTKAWVKTRLRQEVVFLLKNYLAVLK